MTSDRPYIVTAVLLTAGFLAYTLTLYTRLPAGPEAMSAEADAGKTLWQRYNCTACHQVYGLGGYLGPDLTNCYSRRGRAHIRAMLVSGTNTMPVYPLSEADIDALVAYLAHLDASGTADPRTFTRLSHGAIEQP